MASILLISDPSGSHRVIESALGLMGHEVVVAEGHRVRGRYSVAVVGPAHVERAREVSKRVVMLKPSPRAVCDEVTRLLRS